MKTNHLLFLALISSPLFTLINCSPQEERASFVTMLGKDTLAIESFKLKKNEIEAEVVLRSPRTSYQKYRLTFDDQFRMGSFYSASYTPDAEGSQTLDTERAVSIVGDSLQIASKEKKETSTRTIPGNELVLPFIDMVHWPYELVLRKAGQSEAETFSQPLLAGTRILDFEIGKVGADSVNITHPTRGTMYVKTDEDGRLLSLDARHTTRKLKINRTDFLELTDYAKRYAAFEAAGNGVGPLSGRGKTEAQVHGANIVLDYGQPLRRGRELFGALVPWNQRWRTGANRATHFKTDKDLVFDELEVPAGEYTLFTIPAPDGGILIINKQTGQNGQTYDKTLDLGRVPMTISQVDESIELFTIGVEETGETGELQLLWGNTKFSVPFRIVQ